MECCINSRRNQECLPAGLIAADNMWGAGHKASAPTPETLVELHFKCVLFKSSDIFNPQHSTISNFARGRCGAHVEQLSVRA